MPALETTPVPSGRTRIELQIANLVANTAGTTLGNIDSSDGVLWFIGRVPNVIGNTTTYSYHTLFSLEATKLVRDAGRRIYADIPTYINHKSADLLYAMVDASKDSEEVIAMLPTNIAL